MNIIFYSSVECGEEHAQILKDYLDDGVILCDIDTADIKNSKFFKERIILCGSENVLINWAKQWTQADTAGYSQENNIFYIDSKNLTTLQNGAIGLDEARKRIDIIIDFSSNEYKYLCDRKIFWKGKRPLENKLFGNLLFKGAVKKTHGNAKVITEDEEEKNFIIPKPTHIQSQFDLQIVGIKIGWKSDNSIVAIQTHPDCRLLEPTHDTVMRYSSIQLSKTLTVSIGFGTCIVGGVSEIIAPKKI